MVSAPGDAVIVPLKHEPVRPFGVDTTSPSGRGSMKPIFVLSRLPTRNLKVVLPFNGIKLAPNVFLIVGPPTTFTVAFAVLPAPPSFELTLTLLFIDPGIIPVTLTENEQE